MVTDHATDQKKMKEGLVAAYNLRNKRKDAYLFIQSYPRSEWVFLLDELEKLSLEKWGVGKDLNPRPSFTKLGLDSSAR